MEKLGPGEGEEDGCGMDLRANIIMIGQFVSYLVPQSPIQLLPPVEGHRHTRELSMYIILLGVYRYG